MVAREDANAAGGPSPTSLALPTLAQARPAPCPEGVAEDVSTGAAERERSRNQPVRCAVAPATAPRLKRGGFSP